MIRFYINQSVIYLRTQGTYVKIILTRALAN